jgi:uncharacterized protein (DUF2147 family)
MKYYPLTMALLSLALAGAVYAQPARSDSDRVVGVWLTADGKAHIEIFKRDDMYCGKIVWLREPLKEGKPAVDDKNPDEKLRDRPVFGLQLLRGFKFDGENVWTGGKVYDPDSGNDYSGKLTLVDENTMDLRGYVLIPLFGRSERWTRCTGN